MLSTIPYFVSIFFGFTVLLTLYFLMQATHNQRNTKVIAVVWMVLQVTLAYNGFYAMAKVHPERVAWAVVPAIVLISLLLFTEKGRQYLNRLDLKVLTLLHVVRIPVELVLYWLFTYKAVPEIMTFEGRNWDILSGITAPVVYYLMFVRKSMSKSALLVWNVVCLGLLINIVAHAVLSAPLPIQRFGLDQPNIGVLYFPFNLLPSFIVPVVLFSHLAAIRRLIKGG